MTSVSFFLASASVSQDVERAHLLESALVQDVVGGICPARATADHEVAAIKQTHPNHVHLTRPMLHPLS